MLGMCLDQLCVNAVDRPATPSSSSDLFSAPTSDALRLLRSWMTQPGLPLVKLSASDESSPPVPALRLGTGHHWEPLVHQPMTAAGLCQ